MELKDIFGKKIGIFGFGIEGEALFRYLSKHDINNIKVFDEGEISSESKQIIEGNSGQLVQGTFAKEKCVDIEVAFHGPGLKADRIREILPDDAELTTSTNLFFAQKKGKVVAVTGTKGKSTTVGLLSEILKQNDLKFFVGGNIGSPLLDFVDETSDESISVIELSSFQLEDIEYSADVAIILPISSDHLDYHESQGQYFNYHEDQGSYMAAKAQIVKGMDEKGLVIAYDSADIRKIVENVKAKQFFFSEKPIEEGCSIINSDITCSNPDNKVIFDGVVLLCQDNKIPIPNVLAVLTFVFASNLNVDVKKLFEKYQKLPFRIQFVGESQGLKFFNDSAATNPVSTIEAAKTMSGKYSLIMGGSSKGLRFDDLAGHLVQDDKLVKVYLIGQTSDEIEKELKLVDFEKPILRMDSLEDAVKDIKNNSNGFDNVLFSPASASFDQFKNFKDRGEIFNSLVAKQNG